MNRRTDLVDVIQGLARDEGTRQPSAGEWLADLDRQVQEAATGLQQVDERMEDGPAHDSVGKAPQ